MKIKSKNKRAATILICLLPIYITFMAELNSTQHIGKTFTFFMRRPTVMLFNTLFLALLLFALAVLFKRVFISASIVGGLLYILSLVEFFKHGISDSHFIIADIFMVGNAADITRFANLSVKFWMVINLLTLLGYIIACVRLKIEIELKYKLIRLSGVLLATITLWTVLSPQVSSYVYRAFKVDTQPSTNSFAANEKYENNSFIANLLQSSTETIGNVVTKPTEYNQSAISSLLASTTPSDSPKRPNIIFIACESFSDFRCFDSLEIDPGVYLGFDKVAQMETSATGYLFSPTFGGYTARAEFELMTGLPVKGLQNATIPHYLMNSSGDLYSLARFMAKENYFSTYIHPFSKTFYNRDDYYTRYGFDELIFDAEFDDLGIEPVFFGDYISDASTYEAIKTILTRKDNTPNYIFTTTMQNHQPYVSEENIPEFDVYLNAMKSSSDALYDFVMWLEGFEEETILVFLGDHFPFFSSESDIYENLDLRADNCEVLYRQRYIVYGNKERPDIDTKVIFSQFYLPHLVFRAAGLPLSGISTTVLSQLEKYPLYSANAVASAKKNTLLDLLTYDIICGEGYALTDEYPDIQKNVRIKP